MVQFLYCNEMDLMYSASGTAFQLDFGIPVCFSRTATNSSNSLKMIHITQQRKAMSYSQEIIKNDCYKYNLFIFLHGCRQRQAISYPCNHSQQNHFATYSANALLSILIHKILREVYLKGGTHFAHTKHMQRCSMWPMQKLIEIRRTRRIHPWYTSRVTRHRVRNEKDVKI